MKEMNRWTFLKLSGASAVMLALAGCGGEDHFIALVVGEKFSH